MTGSAPEHVEFLRGTTEPILEKPFNLKVVRQVVGVLLEGRGAVGHPSDEPVQDERETTEPFLTPPPATSSKGPCGVLTERRPGIPPHLAR